MKKKTKNSTIQNYIVALYLFIMFCIYPLYVKDGYYNISGDKALFLIYTVMAASGVFVLFLIVECCKKFSKKKRHDTFLIPWKDISISEKLLLLYMAFMLVAYLCSGNMAELLWGTTGWFLGFGTLLLLFTTVFMISRLWDGKEWILYGAIVVSALVFMLGVCNRFSFYPVVIEPVFQTLISTIGNINWFCGYLAVIAPIGVGMFIFSETERNKKPVKKYLLGAYAVLTFVTGFAQGSDSVFLWFGAFFFFMLWVALEKQTGLKNWLLLLIMWALSAQIIRVLKYLMPERYNYIDIFLTDNSLTIWIAVLAVAAYIGLSMTVWKSGGFELQSKGKKIIRISMIAALVAAIGLCLGISIYNTNVGIPILEDNNLFVLDESWGTDRCANMKASLIIYSEMSWWQKLIGVGPDGFNHFAYSNPVSANYLLGYYNDGELTNAHCELLTNLVNAGILGLLTYVGIFVTFIVRCMKRGKEKPVLFLFAACVICYFVHNMVSFAQVMNFPFLFLILGLGEKYLYEK